MAFLAAAGIAAAGAAAYGAYETGQASKRAGVAQRNALAVQKRQQELSEEQQRAALAPTTNARGDRTEYIPGVGWVETPSATTKGLMAASDAEERQRLANDLPQQRAVRDANYRQQIADRGLAGALFARLNEGRRTVEDTEAGQVREGVARMVAGPQQTDNALFTAALRQGSGGVDALRSAQSGNGNSTRAIIEAARNNAPTMQAQSEGARLDPAMARYNLMMNRGTAPADVQFNPTNAGDALGASRMSQQRSAPYGLAMAGANLKPVGEFNTGTNYGQMAGGIVTSLENAYRAYNRYNQPSQPMTGMTMAVDPALSNALLNSKPTTTNNISISRASSW